MATLAQIRDKADAKLAVFWSALQSKQAAYYAKHGKYFQLLISPATEVLDGADSTFAVRHPSDEVYQLDVSFDFPDPIPFQISVDEWVGPLGEGYRAQVYVKLLDGRIFTRHRDSGQNDSGWYEEIILNV